MSRHKRQGRGRPRAASSFGLLQPHVRRRGVLLAEQLDGRPPAVSVQPLGGLGAQVAQQPHGVGHRREGRELRLGGVEQALGVRRPVPHVEDPVQRALELLPPRPLRPCAVEARPPYRGLAGAVGEVDPEPQREARHERAVREVPRQPGGGDVDDVPVRVVRVQLAAPRLPHEGYARRRAVVEGAVALPALAHHAVVGVSQCDLEVADLAHDHLREVGVPLVEVERPLRVAVARGEIGLKALGREPPLRPRARPIALGGAFPILVDGVLRFFAHRRPL